MTQPRGATVVWSAWTAREVLLWQWYTWGTLWSESVIERLTDEIREGVALRVGVVPSTTMPMMAPYTSADPYPSDDASGGMTLAEVGESLGISPSRVQAIELRAIQKLRAILAWEDF